MEEKEIEIRSDEVHEILTEVPHWMIRYGITLIFGIIFACLLLSWFIKYPEVVSGDVEITTEQPPVKLVAKTSGYLQNLRMTDDASVQKGQVLAELSNPVDKEAIDALKKNLNDFTLDSAAAIAMRLRTIDALGSAQNEVNLFLNQLIEYDKLVNDTSFERTVVNLDKQILYNTRLAALTYNQQELYTAELQLASEKYYSDSVLYSSGVIAKMEYYDKQSEYYSKKQTVLNVKKSAVQYQITAADYEEQKNKLLKARLDAIRMSSTEIFSSVKSLYSFADTWQQNYIVEAPIDGKLAYLSNLSENEFVRAEQALFAIIPPDDEILGLIQISNQGFGKIKMDQEVRIKLDNYPYQEFGQLEGRVASISKIAGESGYMVKVQLYKGLKTSYNKSLAYKPGMTGAAEVITEDLRLIERIFNSIRKIFMR